LTEANQANTVVRRNASGNFDANIITANRFVGDGNGLHTLNLWENIYNLRRPTQGNPDALDINFSIITSTQTSHTNEGLILAAHLRRAIPNAVASNTTRVVPATGWMNTVDGATRWLVSGIAIDSSDNIFLSVYPATDRWMNSGVAVMMATIFERIVITRTSRRIL